MANIGSDKDVIPGPVTFKFVAQEPPTPTARTQDPGTGQPRDIATSESFSDDTREQGRESQYPTRVPRACDECRRRKIKCDSRLPCNHCRTHFFDCTYEHVKVKKKRKIRQPQHPEALEDRLQRIEAFIQEAQPLSRGVRDDLPDFDSPKLGSQGPSLDSSSHDRSTGTADHVGDWEDMVTAVGRVSLEHYGTHGFNGTFSGVSFLESFRQLFGDDCVNAMRTQFPVGDAAIPQLFDSVQHSHDLWDGMIILPSQEMVTNLVQSVLDDACILAHFIHRPTFFKGLKLIYETHPSNYGKEEKSFLPLLYSVLALGCLFNKEIQNIGGYRQGIREGLKYLLACRRMINPSLYRDLTTVQAMTFMVLFLKCTLRSSTLYSYVGNLVRLAVQGGLHRALPHQSDLIEKESRIRLFWVIRSIDTYVSTLVGLPRALGDEDIDQSLPTDVNDVYIQKDKISSMPEGQVSEVSGLIAYIGLLPITAKIVRYIYPGHLESMPSDDAKSYLVKSSKIREIEGDLKDWKDRLKPGLWPGDPTPSESVEKIQSMIQMSYLHAQLLLYHPFIQYIGSPKDGKAEDYRSSKYASDCVTLCRTILRLSDQMKNRGLLSGAFWFTCYTTHFAVMALILPVMNNLFSEESEALLKEMESGRAALASIKDYNEGTDRCYRILGICFDRLYLEKRIRSSNLPETSPPANNIGTSQTFSNYSSDAEGDFNLSAQPTMAFQQSFVDNSEGDFNLSAQPTMAFQQSFVDGSEFTGSLADPNYQMQVPLSVFDQTVHPNRDSFQNTLDSLFRNSTRGSMARALLSSNPGATNAFFEQQQQQQQQQNYAAGPVPTSTTPLGMNQPMPQQQRPSMPAGNTTGMNRDELQTLGAQLGFSDLVEGFDEAYDAERWNNICMEEGCP